MARKHNPKSNDNLVPFEKGQSGNPAGRPPVDRELRQLRNDYGAVPLKRLILILSEIQAGTRKASNKDEINILKYLHEQFNGKAVSAKAPIGAIAPGGDEAAEHGEIRVTEEDAGTIERLLAGPDK